LAQRKRRTRDIVSFLLLPSSLKIHSLVSSASVFVFSSGKRRVAETASPKNYKQSVILCISFCFDTQNLGAKYFH